MLPKTFSQNQKPPWIPHQPNQFNWRIGETYWNLGMLNFAQQIINQIKLTNELISKVKKKDGFPSTTEHNFLPRAMDSTTRLRKPNLQISNFQVESFRNGCLLSTRPHGGRWCGFGAEDEMDLDDMRWHAWISRKTAWCLMSVTNPRKLT